MPVERIYVLYQAILLSGDYCHLWIHSLLANRKHALSLHALIVLGHMSCVVV